MDDQLLEGGYIQHNMQIKSKPIKNKDPLISIIIPLYNEEDSIGNVIKSIPNHQNLEILVVDDGSTNKSIERVKEINRKNVYIFKLKYNKGYGYAILTGLRYSNGDIIITMDSDGQHDPKDISKLLKPILNNKADFTVGSQYLGICEFQIPTYKKIGEIFVKICLKFLYNYTIHNNQNGFRAFKSKLIKYTDSIKFKGMGFTTELLFLAASKNFSIKEIPINAKRRKSGSSYVKVSLILKSIITIIFRYFLKKCIKKR